MSTQAFVQRGRNHRIFSFGGFVCILLFLSFITSGYICHGDPSRYYRHLDRRAIFASQDGPTLNLTGKHADSEVAWSLVGLIDNYRGENCTEQYFDLEITIEIPSSQAAPYYFTDSITVTIDDQPTLMLSKYEKIKKGGQKYYAQLGFTTDILGLCRESKRQYDDFDPGTGHVTLDFSRFVQIKGESIDLGVFHATPQ